MSDNLNIKQPQDPKKINLGQAWEVSYWTSKFGVTKEILELAIKAVGVMAVDVQAWLKKN